MKLHDTRISQLAENIVEHKHLLTDEVMVLSLIYGYLDQYVDDVKLLVNFYEEVKVYAFNLRYGDLGFFRNLFENNYTRFKEITNKMQQFDCITNSIDEMEQNTNELLQFIEKEFCNTNIKVDLLKYSQNFMHYLSKLRLYQERFVKLKNNSSGNGLM